MSTMIPYGNVFKQAIVSLVLSPAQVNINTTAEQTFTLQGVDPAVDMVTAVSKPTAQAGLGIVNARVSAVDQIAITFSNNTGGAITPTALQTYLIKVERRDASQGNFS